MDSDKTQAEALSVKDGRILAVGNSSAVLEMADSETIIIDLNGRTLMPGFVDSHTHIFNNRAKAVLNEYMPNGTLEEAQTIVEAWRQEYNNHRPHSSLSYLTPSEFARRYYERNQVTEANQSVEKTGSLSL